MEMMAVPESWAVSSVGDVSEYIQRGKSPKYADLSRLPVVNQRSIRWHGIQDEYLKYVHEDQFSAWDEARFIQEGDILWNSTGTGTIGRACLVRQEHTDPPKVVDSHVTIVRTNKRIVEPGYLFAWIRGPEVQQKIEDLATGTTNQIELNRSTIASTLIPIAPLNEQRRIAAKLDTTLAAVDACRQRLDGVAAILKRFRQAVLAAATSGELTREWREDNPIDEDTGDNEVASLVEKWISSQLRGKAKIPAEPDLRCWTTEIPQSWHLRSVSMFAECLDSQRIPVKKDKRNAVQGTYPYYGANGIVDMVDEYIFDGELVLVTEDETFYGREKPIAYRSSGKCWVNNHAHVLRPEDAVAADYLCYCLMHYPVLPWLTGTTGRAKLTQGVLNSLPVAIPPRMEMEQIVSMVQALFTLADQLEARLTTARKIVDRLTPALLAKAFRGELVPQDPNDEPASELLARIRAARQADAAAGKPSRRGRRKAAINPDQIEMESAPVPADFLAGLLRECGALSERALWAVSELEPQRFQQQLYRELESGTAREVQDNGQVLLEAVG